jgi:hypothetical protein
LIRRILASLAAAALVVAASRLHPRGYNGGTFNNQNARLGKP